MTLSFTVSKTINKNQKDLYDAWLDSGEHSRMTGSNAQVSDKVGQEFHAWDGYIQGRNITLEPNHRIVQSWRTTDFADDEALSLIEILFDEEGEGTKITLHHTNLPPHGIQYQSGWHESYFNPMKAYFEGK